MWAIGFLFFLNGCKPSGKNTESTATQDSSQLSKNKVFKHQVKVKYAKNFSIEYHDHYKVVHLLKPFQNSDATIRYVLVPRDTPAPKGFKKQEIIQIPVRKVITLSHTHVAFIQELGQIASVQGVSAPQFLTNPTLLKKYQENKLVVAGTGMELNNETILAAQPDIVMASGMVSSAFKQYQTLLNTGIPVIINSEWLEKTPLGRAEWIKFLAVFYNQEQLVNDKFEKIAQDYLHLKQLTQNVEKRPTILLGLPFKGTWYMPRGESFVGQLSRDAGAHYYWKDEKGIGSMPLDFEAVYGTAQGADVWFVEGTAKTLKEITDKDTRFGDFAAFKTQRVYNNDKKVTDKGVNIFLNTSLVHPNWVLADMIKILHPSLLPEHHLVYYRKLP